MQQTIDILKKHWGYSSFRTLQGQIIDDICRGNDVLALLPTGGGKSICFQVPALYLEGVCVVISPLIALIEDQIENLAQKGIEAVSIPSGSKTNDIVRIFDNIVHKNIKLLYLSPERLQQDLIQEKLKQINISFFAIDEAHCISEWGHDFRPSYLKLENLKVFFPNIPITAVTATATQKVQEQILSVLNLKQPCVHRASIERNNLALQVFYTNDKFDLLRRILSKQSFPTIIYLNSRIKTYELHQLLSQIQIKSTYYHAGLSPQEKEQNFQLWKREKTPVMVATNAFGMGIDKENVRLVIHLNIPKNLESYSQEAGRAGRDGKKSFSCVILNANDSKKHNEQFTSSLLLKEELLAIYSKLNQYFQIALGELANASFDINLQEFADQYDLTFQKVKKGIQVLNNHQVVQYEEILQEADYIQITYPVHQFINYLDSNNTSKKILEPIIRSHSGVFDQKTKINIFKISKHTGISIKRINETLTKLEQQNILLFFPKSQHDKIRFLVPREDKATINSIYKNVKKLQDIEIEKEERLLTYFSNQKQCRIQALSNYFDENTTSKCGICDICLGEQNIETQIQKNVFSFIQTNKRTYNELLTGLRINNYQLNQALQFLIDEESIQRKNEYYQII